MRLLKWLFQPAYILLIIVLVALYVNRALVFPDEVAASIEAEALVAKAEGLIAQLRSEPGQSNTVEPQYDGSVSTEPAVALAEVTGPAEGGASVNGADEVAMQPVDAASDEAPQDGAVIADSEIATNGGEPAFASQAADEVPQHSEAADAEVNREELLPAISSPDEVSASQLDAPALSAAEEDVPGTALDAVAAPGEEAAVTDAEPLVVWRDARAAVWQGDLDTAVQRYRQLIVLQPGNYDAHGELGNVLLAQNKVAAAIESYSDAARLIHRSGHIKMAYQVAGVVASLDEAQGQALFNEFSQQ